MAGVLLLIWVRGEADYFCGQDWTKSMRDLPDGQPNR
jgi:hypothetical protein